MNGEKILHKHSMILHIDTELMEKYDLEIRELWVLTALKVLTCRKPWQGTYEQLAEKSMCGSKVFCSTSYAGFDPKRVGD